MSQKFGLALGSGAWRGLAHIGVIKSLSENNIPIDFIAGSSIGSIIGGLYSALGDIDKVEKIAKSLSFKTIIKSLFNQTSPNTILKNNKFDLFFKKLIGDPLIEDLKIPYVAVGSSLLSGQAIAIDKGRLIPAMKASSAIPLLIGPVRISHDFIFDGGMTSPVPTQIVKSMGADLVMGVSLYGGVFPLKLNQPSISKIKAVKISRFLSLKKLADTDLKSADFSLELKIPHEDYSFFSRFINNQEIIDYGYQATNALIPEIKRKFK